MNLTRSPKKLGIFGTILAAGFTLAGVFLLRYLLGIPWHQLGWREFIGWILLVYLFNFWSKALLGDLANLFQPASPRSGLDPYTEVQAEIAAERQLEVKNLGSGDIRIQPDSATGEEPRPVDVKLRSFFSL